MPLTVDFSSDYTIWDKTESVTLRRRTSGGAYDLVSIATAVRAQPSAKERAISQGVYQGSDLKWLLPGALLASGQQPRQGDQIQDSTTARWTILSTDYDQLDQMYDCSTVNLSLLFDLRDAADFYAPTHTQDAAGARVPTFAASTLQVAARFQLVSAAEEEQRGKLGTVRHYQCYVAEVPSTFTTDWQVRDQSGTIYDVVSWQNAQRLDELPVLTLEWRL